MIIIKEANAYSFNTFDFLCCAIETIKHFGYVKAVYNTFRGYRNYHEQDNGLSTLNRAKRYYLVQYNITQNMPEDAIETVEYEMKTINFNSHSAENKKLAQECLDWIKIEDDSKSDYIRKLKQIALKQSIGLDEIGLLVSLPQAYQNHLDWQERNAQYAKAREERQQKLQHEIDTSKYVGNVGDTITVNVAKIEILGNGVQYTYNSPVSYLYKITSTDGNIFLWSTAVDFDIDKVKQITGKIKEFKNFNGVKQTVLTRCKVR